VEGFSEYKQVFAVWSNPDLSPEQGYDRLCRIIDRLESFEIDKSKVILAVEGGSVLNGKLERVEKLAEMGVKILTLMWKGVWCTGGAFDTSEGLSEFGVNTVKECFNVGIIPDVSHTSDKSFYHTVKLSELYGKPIIASHSNSRGVYNHPRNITDEMFSIIRQLGGVVGISAYPGHLTDGKCTTETMLRHIDRYMELDGEDTVCLGCDFDGIETTPENLSNPGELENLYLELDKRGYGERTINKIFYQNAADFFNKISV
jgi:membrane dipeptidase